MPQNNNNQGLKVNTQIRNLYSDGMSYLNVSFFNSNLSLKFFPFQSKDSVGRTKYDTDHGQNTTVNYEGAYALWQMSKDIIDGKVQECNMVIPCAGNATITLERKMGNSGQMETTISISKNNVLIPFRFPTVIQQVKENNKPVTKVIETGLGVFMKTLNGYLEGINADRHLDKYTDEWVKFQEGKAPFAPQPQQSFQKKNYNNNYRRPYNGPRNNNGGWNGPPNQQDMSSYSLPN